MSNLEDFVPKVEFKLIPIKDLVSNQEYQRNVYASHVEHTAAEFDVYQINPVKVSRRNGINYVFDGQHTIEIVALASGSRETPVWCMIYDDLNYTMEADIFANQKKGSKPLLAAEVFIANVEANNPIQLTIKELVESYGLSIEKSRTYNSITAVSTLERIYLTYGYHVLDQTLRLITATWEGIPNSFSSPVLSGVARLVYAFGDELKEDAFKEKLSLLSIKEISRLARERRNGSYGYAEVMLNIYNTRKSMRTSLHYEKLYATKKIRPNQAYDNGLIDVAKASMNEEDSSSLPMQYSFVDEKSEFTFDDNLSNSSVPLDLCDSDDFALNDTPKNENDFIPSDFLKQALLSV